MAVCDSDSFVIKSRVKAKSVVMGCFFSLMRRLWMRRLSGVAMSAISWSLMLLCVFGGVGMKVRPFLRPLIWCVLSVTSPMVYKLLFGMRSTVGASLKIIMLLGSEVEIVEADWVGVVGCYCGRRL
jgi:hypothetical protein